MLRKNVAGQAIPFGLTNLLDGTTYTGAAGTITVLLVKDAVSPTGTQSAATGTVSATTGTPQKGYVYYPSQADTNCNSLGITIYATGTNTIMYTLFPTAADPTNANTFGLAALPQALFSGTALSGGSNYLQLPASATATEQGYRNYEIWLTGGPGAGEKGLIFSYRVAGAGSYPINTVVIDHTWLTTPTSSTTFAIVEFKRNTLIRASGICQVDANTLHLALDSVDDGALNVFKGMSVVLHGGTGKGQIRNIVSNTAAPNVVCTIDRAWDVTPDATSIYVIGDAADLYLMNTMLDSGILINSKLSSANVTGNLPAIINDSATVDLSAKLSVNAQKLAGAVPNNLAAGSQMDLVPSPNTTAIAAFKTGLSGLGTYLTGILSTPLTESVLGQIEAAFKTAFDVSSPRFTMQSYNQGADNNIILANGTYGNAALNAILSSGSYGNAALLTAIQNVQNGTFISATVPPYIETPATGSVSVTVVVLFYSEIGVPTDLDSGLPVATIVNDVGTDLTSARLSFWTHGTAGQYSAVYTNSSGDAQEGIHWTISGTLSGHARKFVQYMQIVNSIASTFTPTDRTNLNNVLAQTNKLGFDGSNNLKVVKNATDLTDNTYSVVANGVYGNAAIQTIVSGLNTILTNATYGNAAIETIVAGINTILTNGTYGNSALQSMINTINNIVGSGTYGNSALRTLIAAIPTNAALTAQQTANALLLQPSGSAASGSVMAELQYLMDNAYGALQGLITFVNSAVASSGNGLTYLTAKKTFAEAAALYSGGQQGVINLLPGSGYNENLNVPSNVEVVGIGGVPEIFGSPTLTSVANIIVHAQSKLTNLRFKGQQSAVHVPSMVQLGDNTSGGDHVVITACSSDPQHATFDCLFDFSWVSLGVVIQDCYFGGADGTGSITTACGAFNNLTACSFQRNLWNGWNGDVIYGQPAYTTFYQDRFIGVHAGHYGINIMQNLGIIIQECCSTGAGQLYFEQPNAGNDANSIINNDQWGSIPTQQYLRDANTLAPTLTPVAGSIDSLLGDLETKTNNKVVWEYLAGAYTGKVYTRNASDTANYAYSYARNPVTLAVITNPNYNGPINFDPWTLI